MQRMVILIFGLGALAALAFWCLRSAIPHIEQDLHARSTAALSAAGMAALVSIDGQVATLSGEVATAEMSAAAARTVAAVRGVVRVDNRIAVRAAPPDPGPFEFQALLNDDQVVLSGHVAGDAERASLVGAARQQFRERRVIDQLRDHGGAPDGVTAALRTALGALAALRDGRVQLDGRRVELTGTAVDAATADGVEASFAQLGRQGFQPLANLRLAGASRSAVAACQSRLDESLSRQVIRFATGSAVISADSFPLLDEVARTIKDCGGMSIEVGGHTDSLGNADDNRRLSFTRASAVRDYLVAEGVGAERLTAHGYGAERPVADNGTAAGRARNRRIEFRALGTDE